MPTANIGIPCSKLAHRSEIFLKKMMKKRTLLGMNDMYNFFSSLTFLYNFIYIFFLSFFIHFFYKDSIITCKETWVLNWHGSRWNRFGWRYPRLVNRSCSARANKYWNLEILLIYIHWINWLGKPQKKVLF